MTLSSWWLAFRGAMVVGALTAVGVAAALFAFASTQPPEYEARFSLLASPSNAPGTTNADLASTASLTLPSLTELARSPAVLERVTASVDGVSDPGQLAGRISVELVPDSGFARISVTDADPDRASQLAESLSSEIRSLDLLGPAGVFRSFDSDSSTAHKVSPDQRLGSGFALVAGTIAGLLAGGLVVARWPRLASWRQAARVVNDRSVPVLTYDRRTLSGYDVSELLSSLPGQVVPVSGVARTLGREAGITFTTDLAEPTPGEEAAGQPDVVLVAALGRTTPEELRSRCALLHAYQAKLVALILV